MFYIVKDRIQDYKNNFIDIVILNNNKVFLETNDFISRIEKILITTSIFFIGISLIIAISLRAIDSAIINTGIFQWGIIIIMLISLIIMYIPIGRAFVKIINKSNLTMEVKRKRDNSKIVIDLEELLKGERFDEWSVFEKYNLKEIFIIKQRIHKILIESNRKKKRYIKLVGLIYGATITFSTLLFAFKYNNASEKVIIEGLRNAYLSNIWIFVIVSLIVYYIFRSIAINKLSKIIRAVDGLAEGLEIWSHKDF